MVKNSDLSQKVLSFDRYAFLFYENEILMGLDFKKYETEDSIIWLANPNEAQIKVNNLEKIDNINFHVYDIDGIWACLIKNKVDNKYRAITSIHNELPWYYNEESGNIVSSNIFLLATYLDSIKINYEAISSFLAFDFCYNGETFIKNIRKTYGGDIIYLHNGGVEIKGCNLTEWLGFDESVTDSNLVLDCFIKSVNKSLQGNNPQITLTAGSDSRAILGAAYTTHQNFTLMTGVSSSTDRRDVKIASQIANILDKKHQKIDESKRQIENINKALEEVTIQTSAQFIPRNWLIYYKEYLLNTEYLQSLSRLMGYRGEFFKGFYKNLDSTIIRNTFFLRKDYSEKLSEIVNQRLDYYKNLSKTNAYELFYHRERDNFWVSSNIRAMLQSGCKIYTPFSDNDLLKLGYRFVGGIKNVNLHKKAIDLLPNQIKEIPTSNNRLTFIIKYIYRKSINHNNYNFFLEPKFIKNNLDYELLNEIIKVEDIDSLISKYNLLGHHDTLVHKLFAVSYFFKLLGYTN
jgi:hypothetical protein